MTYSSGPTGGWRGLVTFITGPGEQYLRWEPEDVIRLSSLTVQLAESSQPSV